MSLRAFHLLFIALSVVLTAFVAAWAGAQYRSSHDMQYALSSVMALSSGVALSVYGARFQRRTRHF